MIHEETRSKKSRDNVAFGFQSSTCVTFIVGSLSTEPFICITWSLNFCVPSFLSDC